MKLIYGSWDRMQDDKRAAILDQAGKFIDSLTFEAAYGKGDHAEGYRRR